MAVRMDEILNKVDEADVSKWEALFDQRISRDDVFGETFGGTERPGYRIYVAVLSGTLKETTKKELHRRYTEAGWDVKAVGNSGDRGERPGLCFVEFWIADEKAVKKPSQIVEWIVNDLGELGVKVGERFFFLYKGESFEYEDPTHTGEPGFEAGTPIRWRPVEKREFGEVCRPTDWKMDIGDWKPLPKAVK